MNYNEYIKNKLFSLYLKNEKIGYSLIDKNTFSFLNDFIINVKQNDYSLSQSLNYIFEKLDKDKKLKNLVGEDFLSELENLKRINSLNAFRKQTTIEQQQITDEQKEELTQKYTEVAKKYGLKEFYYSLDPLLNPEENFNKALLLLDKIKLELDKLQQVLNIKDSHKIGNGILSIQVNSQQETKDNGHYDFLSNTIRLKDETTTFPLTHEYVHFLDKTTAALLLTGKTTQQLYEINEEKNIDLDFIDRSLQENKTNEKYTKIELKELFDMSIFSQISYKDDKFPWIKIKQVMLACIFNKEINQNKYIQKVFNQSYSQEDNIVNFKQIVLNWIEEKNYPNKELLKRDINNIFEHKKTNTENYSQEEFEILEKTRLFKEEQLEDNYFMKCSKIFDSINSGRENKSATMPSSNVEFYDDQVNQYYQTQKEMLARTIEQTLKDSKHEQLSDRLTTPQLSQEEQQKFFEIIKSWQNISCELLEKQKKQSTSNMVQKVIGKFRDFAIKELENESKPKLK